jgi:predicted dehydrogenase
MHKLGMGIIGVGAMGRRHAENLRRSIPNADLLAVVDADMERSKMVAAQLEVEHCYDRIEPVLERRDIHSLVITVPDNLHARFIQVAALAGKDIFCEKPLATNLADAEDALEAVDRAGVRLQLGFMRRYDPGYAEAKKRIEAGEIGEPVIFKSVGRDREGPPPQYYQSGLWGTLFVNSAVHEFDLARWLMDGEVAEVHAYGCAMFWPEAAKAGDVIAGVANLRFQNGAIGNVESFLDCKYGDDTRTEVIGTQGTVVVGSLQGAPITALFARGKSSGITGHWLERFSDAYLAEMRDFVETMLDDRSPKVAGEDGLRALKVSLAAQQSYAQSRPVLV